MRLDPSLSISGPGFSPGTLSFAWRHALLVGFGLLLAGGCATIRVTDPPRTATEEFLLTGAAERAVEKLSFESLRDRVVWLDTGYALSTSQPYQGSFLTNEVRQPSFEEIFLVGEVRAKLLKAGVRLARRREDAKVVLEMRTGGLSIDREEYLLGIPATSVPTGSTTSGIGQYAVATSELAILKTTKQFGFASITIVAYWTDTGELLGVSGPFVGRSTREDHWFLGAGPFTSGDIPPAQK